MAQQGSAVQVISIENVDDGQVCKLDIEALKRVLTNDKVKDRYISVISIAGAMRTGKSFILDYFLRFLNARYVRHNITDWIGENNSALTGFNWHGGMERVTSGIMVWSELFTYDDASNGNKIAILLMDTQGVFDSQSTVLDNTVIFAMGTLTSSHLIYNIKGNLQENDLQNLQLFTEYGKQAAKATGQTPFQRLTFLIRDWGAAKDAPYGAKGGKIIIDRQFNPKAGQKPELKEVRDHIKSCFNDLNCYLLMHPGFKLTEDQDSEGKIEDLRPEFIDQLKDFVPKILSPEGLVLKKINGRLITAGELVNFFIPYIEIFNSGEIPKPETILNAISKTDHLTAADAGFTYYYKNFTKITGKFNNIQEIDDMHSSIKNQAVEKFNTDLKFPNETTESFRQKLRNKCDELYAPVRARAVEQFATTDGPIDAPFIVQLVEFFFGTIQKIAEEIVNTVIVKPIKAIGKLFGF